MAKLGHLILLEDGETSIGIGKQSVCGVGLTGHACPSGTKELDRGSCSGQTLFGDAHYLGCATDVSTTAPHPSCPFITVGALIADSIGPRAWHNKGFELRLCRG
eukprot:3709829-Prymnesium_polylepis.1